MQSPRLFVATFLSVIQISAIGFLLFSRSAPGVLPISVFASWIVALLLLWRWPKRQREIAGATLIATCLAIAFAIPWLSPLNPGALLWLLMVPLYAILLRGPKSSLFFMLVALVIQGSCAWLHPPSSVMEWYYASNYLVATFFITLISCVSWRATQFVYSGLNTQTKELETEEQQRQQLIQTFSDQLSPPLDRLTRISTLDTGLLASLVAEMKEALNTARENLPPRIELSSTAARTLQTLSDLRSRSFRGLVIAYLTIFLLLLIRNVFFLHQTPTLGLLQLSLGSLPAALWLQKKMPEKIRIIGWGVLGSLFFAHYHSTLRWGFAWPGPSVIFWPTFALFAFLIDGIRGCLLTVLITFGFIAAYLAFGTGGPAMQNASIHLGILMASMLATCWIFWILAVRMLKRLHERHTELAQALSTRRRLIAILFHDLANPLSALELKLSIYKIHPEKIPTEQLTQLVERMKEILDSVRTFALSDGEISPSALRTVSAAEVLKPLQEVFAERMRNKGQTLLVSGDMNTRFLAEPSVLCNSVLGNLMSNAIKFAPNGSTVEVAIESGSKVGISIRDRGPGIPQDLIHAVSEGIEPTPQKGSSGELGRGLGLMISNDFVRRMGGTLELLSREGGGTSATIWLKQT